MYRLPMRLSTIACKQPILRFLVSGYGQRTSCQYSEHISSAEITTHTQFFIIMKEALQIPAATQCGTIYGYS